MGRGEVGVPSESGAPVRPASGWFNPLAAFLGPAYLRNAFTKGTEQEVAFLLDALRLTSGMHLLDVGCGPGRHSLAFARRGLEVVGIDLSPAFTELAGEAVTREGLPARFLLLDVRELGSRPELDSAFDAVVCLCQGGFGLLGGDDDTVVGALAGALRPGGRLALTAFSSYFAVRHLEPGEAFEPATGVLHETAALRDATGEERLFELWTTCFTPRELVLLAERAGLVVEGVHAVRPGAYGLEPPSLDAPEHLLLARRP